MGTWLAPGVRNVPRSRRIRPDPGDRLSRATVDYELRMTNELEEAIFIDRVQLLASSSRRVEYYPTKG